MISIAAVAVFLLACPAVFAIDNGLGLLPPMGWRSWNCYHDQITQDKMLLAAQKMVEKRNGVSLLDVGFTDCGLDDYYQACGTGVGGSFHNASGYPLIDTTKFPSMKNMTDTMHALGLTAGFYENNCGCNEHQNEASWGPPASSGANDGVDHYKGDVQAIIDFGFDGIKLDGCGEFLNLTYWAELLNATGKPVTIENCHWGGDGPGTQGPGWCPFNFFRTSGDITNTWASMFGNLQTTIKWQPWAAGLGNTLTGPGCYAYPDMLEVGQLASFEEDRAHFGAWCVVSAPLVLGFDVTNDDIADRVWPIVTNTDAIKVSQTWAGHPGSLVQSWSANGTNNQFLTGTPPSGSPVQHGWAAPTVNAPGPLKQGGLCVDFAVGTSSTQIQLAACTGSPSQTFTLEQNGNLHQSAGQQLCLAIENLSGPGMVTFSCNTGTNEEFVVSGGTVCSKNGYCLGVSSIDPSGGTESTTVQAWAKPMGKDSVAVLFLNNDATAAHSVSFDLAVANFTGASAAVYDIWAQNTAGVTGSTFTTDAIAPHDSRFYIFSVPSE